VAMPVQSDVVPGGESLFNGDNPPQPVSGPAGAAAYEFPLTFDYTPHNVNDAVRSGTYYTVNGEDGLLTTGARPILPLTTSNLSSPTEVAHGVLMAGSTFTDLPGFDPVITNIISQEVSLEGEGIYPIQSLYPLSPVSI